MNGSTDWEGRVPVQNPDLAWRIVDEECILVDPQGSQATVLNRVGARIWQLADGKRTVADILDLIFSEYAVDRERLTADARDFLDDLRKRKIIHFDGEA